MPSAVTLETPWKQSRDSLRLGIARQWGAISRLVVAGIHGRANESRDCFPCLADRARSSRTQHVELHVPCAVLASGWAHTQILKNDRLAVLCRSCSLFCLLLAPPRDIPHSAQRRGFRQMPETAKMRTHSQLVLAASTGWLDVNRQAGSFRHARRPWKSRCRYLRAYPEYSGTFTVPTSPPTELWSVGLCHRVALPHIACELAKIYGCTQYGSSTGPFPYTSRILDLGHANKTTANQAKWCGPLTVSPSCIAE